MIEKIAPYWKAVVAFLAPGLVLIGQAVDASSPGGTEITQPEIVRALVACFVTSAAVYLAPKNRPRE